MNLLQPQVQQFRNNATFLLQPLPKREIQKCNTITVSERGRERRTCWWLFSLFDCCTYLRLTTSLNFGWVCVQSDLFDSTRPGANLTNFLWEYYFITQSLLSIYPQFSEQLFLYGFHLLYFVDIVLKHRGPANNLYCTLNLRGQYRWPTETFCSTG